MEIVVWLPTRAQVLGNDLPASFWESPLFIVLGAIASAITLVWLAWVVIGHWVRKPRVRLDFGDLSEALDHRHLICTFYNDQLTTWLFSALNIKRDNIDEFWISAALW